MTQPKKSYKSKLILSAIAASVIAVTGYVHVISNTPDIKQTKEILKIQQIKNSDQVVGDAFTATNIQLIETLLNKTGGFTSNDLLVKAKVFDNMPNWEEGVIGMVKDSVLTLEKEFSRSQSQDLKDKKLSEAFSSISYSPTSWWFPSSEDQYKKASNALGDYLSRISEPKDKNAQFYARADNLRAWLDLVSNSLGSYSQRLSASVEQERFNTDLSNDKAAVQSTYSDQKVVAKTPWLEIDDVYWETRGASWALIQLLYAVEDDFGTVLKDKNAVASMKQIIRDLEDTQKTRYWPVVLNGSPFGVTANHSLGMANYISRANNGIIELIRLLERG
ncbi:DUF2333 family protein [Vibrio sp. 947]|uniref:DUF2333 family protein n=1 Tax=unclassified Vibrio TaxID=2614977 RepID=UPI0029652744|nr:MULTISPECIES: DUF2333 family protein [unclassified Vibrio]MDW1584160.1 DUF2333 family protein [Vibrio sp. Vb2897]MDW1642431.1 DUF2333 family protein [Vibrio sp. Vb2896]MDW1929078.1 DUF2333 family protein [Vibrio sp. 947]